MLSKKLPRWVTKILVYEEDPLDAAIRTAQAYTPKGDDLHAAWAEVPTAAAKAAAAIMLAQGERTADELCKKMGLTRKKKNLKTDLKYYFIGQYKTALKARVPEVVVPLAQALNDALNELRDSDSLEEIDKAWGTIRAIKEKISKLFPANNNSELVQAWRIQVISAIC